VLASLLFSFIDHHVSQEPIRIFDRGLQRHRLARALAGSPADFLLKHAAQDLIERLAAVKRDFVTCLDIGTPGPVLAEALAAGGKQVVRLSPLAQTIGHAHVLNAVGDEEALPLAPRSFDLAVSVLALHAVNDLPGALIQIRQCLKPDGLLLACLCGGRTLHELRSAFAIAETEIMGGISPRVAPFVDVRDMGGLLQRAGYALPVADIEPLNVRYDSLFNLMADLRAMGATNTLVERARKPPRRKVLMRAAEIYAERFSDPDGRIRATFELLFISGWAPHESQQKPLAPGSAKMSLAEALGTSETKLQD
jgi:SAM-dependent methyltransferase